MLGPVQSTPTHPGAPGLGWAGFAQHCGTVALPVYALGGLTTADIPKAHEHRAQGIAAIRGYWG